jgi:DnaJ-class molecular chaperone
MVDHYKILEVNKNADEDTIRKSYKKLALKYHPDRNKDNQIEATEKFKKISESYDVLSNKEKRQQYDTFGNDSVGIPFSTQNANDIFAQFFGNGGININQEMSFSGSSESIQTSTVIQGNKKITTRIIQKNGQVTKEVIEELITDGGNNGSVSSNNFNFTFSF